jgi:predicted protein tyrosine phosphatase
MSNIHVCPLSQVPSIVKKSGARSLVTLINEDTPVIRPQEIQPERHLFIAVSDIVAAMEGHITPAEAHIETLLGFVRKWDRAAPLLIHCYAGVSRSTAAAFIAACALAPDRKEDEIALAIRRQSPTATPNAKLVSLADSLLGRSGRMIEAIARIGQGRACYEGVPFALDLN